MILETLFNIIICRPYDANIYMTKIKKNYDKSTFHFDLAFRRITPERKFLSIIQKEQNFHIKFGTY